MISKKELMLRIIDLEMINMKYEEKINDLEKRVIKSEKPKKTTRKKSV